MSQHVTIRYFALVGPARGTQTAPWETDTATVRELLHEIQADGRIPLATHIAKAAVNDAFVDWDAPFCDGDRITFLPPFSGG